MTKKAFIAEMDKLIDSKTKETRKHKIEEYKKYILNHWRGIQNMKDSLCKSSMEAHIEHCVASTFSSIPKAYSANHIEQYLKLHEMFLNGISILSYYLQTFNNNDDFVYNSKEKELDLSMFENSNSNVPILYTANNLNTALSGICHPSGLFR